MDRSLPPSAGRFLLRRNSSTGLPPLPPILESLLRPAIADVEEPAAEADVTDGTWVVADPPENLPGAAGLECRRCAHVFYLRS